MRAFAEAAGMTQITLQRRFGDAATLRRRIELRRFTRVQLPGVVDLTLLLERARTPNDVTAAIDAAVPALFDPARTRDRAIRTHVLGCSVGDVELRHALAAITRAECDRLTEAIAATARFSEDSPCDPRAAAHVWMAIAFGHAFFDHFPDRPSWHDTLRGYRNTLSLLLQGSAPTSPSAAPPPKAPTPPREPPERHEDARAERLVQAAMKAIAADGERGVSLSAVAAEAGVGIAVAYRHFAGLDGVIEAALARALAINEAPDVERFMLQSPRDRASLQAFVAPATAASLGSQRIAYRAQRSILRAGLFARPALAGIAAYTNALLTERVVALHERWSHDAATTFDHRASAYLTMALSEGLSYGDPWGADDLDRVAIPAITWLFATLGRLDADAERRMPPLAATTEPPLLAPPRGGEEPALEPILTTAPQRSRSTTRATILAAARRAALEEGARGLHIAALARRVGLPTANVQYYFPSNELLINSLAGELLTERSQAWEANLAQGDALRRTRLLLDVVAEPTAARTLAVLRSYSADPLVAEAIDANRRALRERWHAVAPVAAAEDERRALLLLLADAIGAVSDDAERYAALDTVCAAFGV
jgi:AcrR family transcriptional regulator